MCIAEIWQQFIFIDYVQWCVVQEEFIVSQGDKK